MNADERGCVNSVAEQVLGAAFEVSNTLGAGFLEKIYRNALVRELHLRHVATAMESKLLVRYKAVVVDEYYADVVVANRIIIELKCVEAFSNEHLAQCLNFLRATNLHLALLINFQRPRVEIQRLVHQF